MAQKSDWDGVRPVRFGPGRAQRKTPAEEASVGQGGCKTRNNAVHTEAKHTSNRKVFKKKRNAGNMAKTEITPLKTGEEESQRRRFFPT